MMTLHDFERLGHILDYERVLVARALMTVPLAVDNSGLEEASLDRRQETWSAWELRLERASHVPEESICCTWLNCSYEQE